MYAAIKEVNPVDSSVTFRIVGAADVNSAIAIKTRSILFVEYVDMVIADG